MNAKILLVGLASGAASAALSTALASGTLFSVFLFCFAPLPIFIAALGWRHHAGLIGTITAALILAALPGFEIARSYALSVGIPSWWLAYLALLGRPTDPDHPEQGMAWYPVGRLIVWTAAISCVLVLITIAFFGGSVEDYRAALRTTFEAFLRAETGTPAGETIVLPGGGGDVERMTEIAVLALPPVAAALWTTLALINLWVAGRVVRASGLLARPWPDLSAFNPPALSLIAFIGGIAGSALPGLTGFAAGVIGASFMVVYAALGLALIHAGTRGMNGRNFMLSVMYVLLALQTWVVVILAAIGILEFLFGLRARIAATRRPGTPPT